MQIKNYLFEGGSKLIPPFQTQSPSSVSSLLIRVGRYKRTIFHSIAPIGINYVIDGKVAFEFFRKFLMCFKVHKRAHKKIFHMSTNFLFTYVTYYAH